MYQVMHFLYHATLVLSLLVLNIEFFTCSIIFVKYIEATSLLTLRAPLLVYFCSCEMHAWRFSLYYTHGLKSSKSNNYMVPCNVIHTQDYCGVSL